MAKRKRPSKQPLPLRAYGRDLLDILALGAWGIMLVKYWITGKLYVLLHPDYQWLSNTAAVVLLLMATFKLLQLIVKLRQPLPTTPGPSHFMLLPAKWSSFLLLAVAVFGLIYTPRAFASDTALQRGVSDTLSLTRSQPQRFVRQTQPEERTIIDWVRTLNVYPEPDAYTDQGVNVKGFVIHPEEWPDDYLMISRFVLTCCAADAYPVGLPVKVIGSRKAYPVDGWLEVTGNMMTETLNDRRQLVIKPTDLENIDEPRNPYEY
ncbi:MAG: TIGR03943 family protein [Cyanobacteria bacterium J06635_1]